MTTDLMPITRTLKAAREAKGLTQRALAERAGVPQSHISRIESGAVDLQTSSLIQLARALDLELSLVPRQIVPAVDALARGSAAGRKGLEPVLDAYLHNLSLLAERAARRPGGSTPLAAMRREIAALRTQHLDAEASEGLRNIAHKISRVLRRLQDRSKGYPDAPLDEQAHRSLDWLTAQLRKLNDDAMREAAEPRAPRPAYGLDEDDDDV
ncbi:MAG TPA: helix-turn-helix transcriptional regulator [Rhizomicrobium sp.]|nr:helix-turn-helix transcriptional regulator [Rhizomicrobium sp.]